MANLYNVPLQNSVQLALQNALNTGDTTTMTFTTNVTTKLQASSTMKGILIIDRIDSTGTETPTKLEIISFTGVTGSTVTGLTRGLAGTTDQDHAVGAVVEFMPDVTWAQAINDVFIEQHNANGTHKTLSNLSLASATFNNGFINGSTLASSTIFNSLLDTTTFNSNNVVYVSNSSGSVNNIVIRNSLTSTHPSITAIGTDTNISLGIYGKGSGNVYPQIKAERISATGNSSATGTAVDVTGATVTFTPPFNAMAIVNTVFDCNVGVNNDIGSGYLNVNGTDQSQTAIMQQSSNTNRLTIGQTYAVSLASGTSCTLKLRIIRNSGTGVFTAYSPHTGFSYFLIAT